MHKYILPVALSLAGICQAQTPLQFNYQAIARDAQTFEPYRQQQLDIQVSILNKNSSVVYAELHDDITTNSLGVFTVSIGDGLVSQGSDLGAIDWADGPFSMKVEINTGNGYKSLGESPIVYVPYALYARTSGSSAAIPNGSITGAQLNQMGAANGQILQWNGSAWAPVTITVGGNYTAGTGISINNNAITNLAPDVPVSITGGNANTSVTGSYPNFTVTASGDNWGSTTVQHDNTLGGNGTAANPLLIAKQGASDGQVLKWSDANNRWQPGADLAGSGGDDWGSQVVQANAPLSGNGTTGSPLTLNALSSANIQDGSITGADLAAGVIPTALPPSGAASNDLSGTYPGPTVARIQGRPVSASAPANGQALLWNGSNWAPGTISGSGWGLTGNAATDPASNFIGTTDNQPLAFRTNNTVRLKLWMDGRLEIFGSGASGANTLVGQNAGNASMTGDGNCFFGKNTGNASTSGTSNAFFGNTAGLSNKSGNDNTAIGTAALRANTNGRNNVAIGSQSLYNSASASNLVAIGDSALFSNTTGFENMAVGSRAMFSNVGGFGNVALGYRSLFKNDDGFYNAAMGNQSLFSNVGGFDNTAMGHQSLYSNTEGFNNTGIGYETLFSNIDGFDNTAVGFWALYGNTTGLSNTAVGSQALEANTTGNDNTAIGVGTLNANTTGDDNIAIGSDALRVNDAGSDNIAIGSNALTTNTTGNENTAVGTNALNNNTIGEHNISIGHEALRNNTDGLENTAIGAYALFSNTGASGNTAIGFDALYENTGSNNTATGRNALTNNTTGNFNTGLGHNALGANTIGQNNVAVGQDASSDNTTGEQNVAVGRNALAFNKTGSSNTAIGTDAGPASSFTNLQNTTAIGFSAAVTANNTIAIGNSSITSIKGNVDFSMYSDARIKNRIAENVPGIAFIRKLRPVTYHYDVHRQNELMGIADTTFWAGKYDKEQITFSGFIAQEVEQAAQEIGYDFSGVDKPRNEKSLYGLRYAEFTVPLVKAVQEQQALIETQKSTIDELRTHKQI